MKIFILSVLCLIGLMKISNAQTIVSISVDHGNIGNFYQAYIVTQNTNDTIMYWAQFWLTKNGQKKLQLSAHSGSLTYVEIYLYQSLTPGMYDLTLYLPDGSTVSKPNSFLVNPDPDPASFVSISPDTATPGPEFFTYITGLNTHFDYNTHHGKSFLKQGAYKIETIWQLVIDSTYKQCKFQIPFTAPPGKYDVMAGDELNGDLTRIDGFELQTNPNMPELVSVSPAEAEQRQPGYLIISSKNTLFTRNKYFFPWTGITLRKSEEPDKGHEIFYSSYYIDVYNDTAVRVPLNIPYYHPAGIYDVITKDSLHGELILPSAFTMLPGPFPPSILAVEPDTVFAKDSAGNLNLLEIITVRGRNTHFEYPIYTGIGLPNFINDSTFQIKWEKPYLYHDVWHNMIFTDETDGTLSYMNAFYLVNPTYGIPEFSSKVFKFYPNPTTGIVILETAEPADQSTEIIITNVTGQIIEKIRIKSGDTKTSVNLADKPRGIYFIKLATAKGSDTKKLVLQ